MEPNVWGPPLWFSMHTITMNYPDKPSYVQQRNYHDFFHSLKHVLPCDACREHYTELLKLYPIGPALGSRDDLIAWLVSIHNHVNTRVGKKRITVDQMYEAYNSIYARGTFCAPPAAKTGSTSNGGRSNGGDSAGKKATTKNKTANTLLVAAIVVAVLAVVIAIGIAVWKRSVV